MIESFTPVLLFILAWSAGAWSEWGSSPLRFSSNESVAAGRFSQCVRMHIHLRPEGTVRSTNVEMFPLVALNQLLLGLLSFRLQPYNTPHENYYYSVIKY